MTPTGRVRIKLPPSVKLSRGVHGSISWAAFWLGLGIAAGGSETVARWLFT